MNSSFNTPNIPTDRLFRSAAYDMLVPSGYATDLSATVEVTY